MVTSAARVTLVPFVDILQYSDFDSGLALRCEWLDLMTREAQQRMQLLFYARIDKHYRQESGITALVPLIERSLYCSDSRFKRRYLDIQSLTR